MADAVTASDPGSNAGLTRSSMTSLSIPRGPRVVRTASTTVTHALMLLISCGLPWLVSVPSRSKMICGCCAGPRSHRVMHHKLLSALKSIDTAGPAMGAVQPMDRSLVHTV